MNQSRQRGTRTQLNAIWIGALAVAACLMFVVGCRPAPSPQPQVATSDPTGKTNSSNNDEGDSAKTSADEDHILITETKEIQSGVETRLRLSDGMEVVVPPNAMASGKLHVVKRQVDTLFASNKSFVYYEIETNGTRLDAPATLRFPLDLDQSIDVQKVVVLHRLDNGHVEELAGDYDPAAKVFTVTTPSFSSFSEPQIPDQYVAIGESSLAAAKEVHLRPRYYSQADHGWCWATSFAMLVGSHGKPVHPQEIASLYSAEKNEGFNITHILGYSLDPISQLEASRGLNLVPYRFGGLTQARLDGFLIDQLNHGRPVWIGMPKYAPGQDHAILIIGYRADGFLIHDPSGALIAYLEKRSSDEALDYLHEHGNYLIPRILWKEIVNPWKTQMVVVENALPEDSPTCSIQLPLGDAGLSLERTGISVSTLRSVHHYWNGKLERGAGFSTDVRDESQQGMEGLCNSDYLSKFNVLLHNTGTNNVSGIVNVLLDGHEIHSQDVSLKADTVNQVVSLVDNIATSDGPEEPVAPYQSVAARSDLVAGLNFNRFPLAVGPHELSIQLADATRTRVLDRVVVPFLVRPAIASMAEVEVVAGAAANECKHIVRFQQSPEAVRLGPGLIEYEIWRSGMMGSKKEAPVICARIPSPSGSQVEVELDLPRELVRDGVTLRYNIVAVEKKSGISSPMNLRSRPAVTIPPKGPAQYVLSDIAYEISTWDPGNRKSVKKFGGFKVGGNYQLRLNSNPPFELDLEFKVPAKLTFDKFVQLNKSHDGKPLSYGKDFAIGMLEEAKFSIDRISRITATHETYKRKEVCKLDVRSRLDMFSGGALTKTESEKTKAGNRDPFQISSAPFTIRQTADSIIAGLNQNQLKTSVLPSKDIVVASEIGHRQYSENPIEHEFSHRVTVERGAVASTVSQIFLPGKGRVDIKTTGGGIVVRMKSWINGKSTQYSVQCCFLYRRK